MALINFVNYLCTWGISFEEAQMAFTAVNITGIMSLLLR